MLALDTAFLLGLVVIGFVNISDILFDLAFHALSIWELFSAVRAPKTVPASGEEAPAVSAPTTDGSPLGDFFSAPAATRQDTAATPAPMSDTPDVASASPLDDFLGKSSFSAKTETETAEEPPKQTILNGEPVDKT